MTLTYKDILYMYRVVCEQNEALMPPERRVKAVCSVWNRKRSVFNGYENV